MATVTARTDRKGAVIGYQAKLRRRGFAPVPASKMFDTERAAIRWAESMEHRMDQGEFKIVDQRSCPAAITVSAALDRYKADLIARSGDTENVSRARGRLPALILNKTIPDLTVDDLRGWRDSLIEVVEPATVNRLMTVVKAALNLAADADQGVTISSRAAWQVGLKTLADAEEARNVVINDAVIAALISASYAVDELFGLFIEVAAVTGSRPVQLSRLLVADLQDQGAEPRLMMPTSRKGKGKKLVRRQPVPIPATLAAKLRAAAKGRPDATPLLPRNAAGEVYSLSNHHARPWNRARKAANLKPEAYAPYVLEELTVYALRHSSIVRQILQNVPLRVVAALHDTSVVMIERNYSRFIAGQADAIARAAMPTFHVTAAPALATAARAPVEGQCRHGHSYGEFPPYRNTKGAVVCAECARLRTKKNKAAKRSAAA